MLVVGGVLAAVADHALATGRSLRRDARLAGALVGVLLLLGVGRSAQRTRVWRDNDHLFAALIVDAPLSYRSHYMLGAWEFWKHDRRDGEAEYHKALALFPYDPYMSYNLAEQYRAVGLCAPTLALYDWTFALDAHFPMGRSAFAECLLQEKHYDDAKAQAAAAIENGGSVPDMHRVVFLADSAKAANTRRGVNRLGPVSSAPSRLLDSVQKTGRRAAASRGGD